MSFCPRPLSETGSGLCIVYYWDKIYSISVCAGLTDDGGMDYNIICCLCHPNMSEPIQLKSSEFQVPGEIYSEMFVLSGKGEGTGDRADAK